MTLTDDFTSARMGDFLKQRKTPLSLWLRIRVRAGLCLCLAAMFALGVAACNTAFAQEDMEESDDEEVVGVNIAAAREQLKQVLPPNATREQETAFLLQRERAAFALGESKIRLEALRRLVELHKGTPEVRNYASYLWREELRSGNQERAFEMGEELLAQTASLSARITAAAQMGMDYMQISETARGQSMLRRADSLLAEYRRDAAPVRLDRAIAYVEFLRTIVLQREARFPAAEAAIRSALAANARELVRTRGLPEREGSLSLYESTVRIKQALQNRYVNLLLAQGKHVEAEALAREGMQQALADETLGAAIAYFHSTIARAQIAQRRYADAIASADRSVAIYTKAGLAPSSERMLRARVFKQQALMGLERWPEADAEYSAMLADTADDSVGRRTIASATLRALLGAMNGRDLEALRVIDGVVRNRGRTYGNNHPLTVEAKAVRAMVLQMQGSTGQALSAYREVFGVIFSPEASYDETAPKGLRGIYLPLALRAYLKLVADAAAQNAGRAREDTIVEAFLVADRLRSSRVQQALIDSATRALVSTQPELHAMLRKEQDLRNGQRDIYRDVSQQLIEVDDITKEISAATKALKSATAQGEKEDTAKETTAPAAADPEQQKAQQKAQQQLKILRQKRAAVNKAVDALRKRITGIEAERRLLQQELTRRFPEYARLVNPQPGHPADIAKRLGADEALIALYSTPTHTFTWAVTAKGEPQLHVAAMGEGAVDTAVGKLRNALDIGDKPASARTRFDFDTAYALYRDLLRPVAPLLADARVVNVVSGGSLGQIPFAVLVKEPVAGQAFESAAWFVKEHAISHIASASAWIAVRDAAGKGVAKLPFIGFGDPLFAPASREIAAKEVRVVVVAPANGALEYAALPPLPETRNEILAIAEALGAAPASNAYFGADASRERVMTAPLRDRRVVAFATHGLRAGDMSNLSQPALAMAATNNPDHLPFLTLDDVLKLQLQADWVVLSACNTAAADGRSEEAFSGLGRGFFYAGARAILLTHWAVETTSAQALVTAIFQEYAARPGTARAESLRQAQLAMISGKSGPQFQHPFFWSPYALVGDPSR